MSQIVKKTNKSTDKSTDKSTEKTACCESCGKQSAKQCNRCHTVFYCNVTCQQADWKRHKKSCAQPIAIQSLDAKLITALKIMPHFFTGHVQYLYSVGGVPLTELNQVFQVAIWLVDDVEYLRVPGSHVASEVIANKFIESLEISHNWLLLLKPSREDARTCVWHVAQHIRILALRVTTAVAIARLAIVAAGGRPGCRERTRPPSRAEAHALTAARVTIDQAAEQIQVAAKMCDEYSKIVQGERLLAPKKSATYAGSGVPLVSSLWALLAPAQVYVALAMRDMSSATADAVESAESAASADTAADAALVKSIQRAALGAAMEGSSDISDDLTALALYYQIDCFVYSVSAITDLDISKYNTWRADLAALIARVAARGVLLPRTRELYGMYRSSVRPL